MEPFGVTGHVTRNPARHGQSEHNSYDKADVGPSRHANDRQEPGQSQGENGGGKSPGPETETDRHDVQGGQHNPDVPILSVLRRRMSGLGGPGQRVSS